MARPARITTSEVLAAAGQLLDTGGVEAVTMRGVGDALGVTAMALYRHIGDRDAMVGALVDDAFEDVAARFQVVADSEADVQEKLEGVLDVLVDLALARPHLFRLMFTSARPGARVLPEQTDLSPTLRIVVRLLADGVREGRFRDDDLAEVALGGAALVQGLCLARGSGRVGGSDEEFRLLVLRSVRRYLAGISAR